MNRKYNPYVSLVALVLLALILVLTCTGCHVEAEASTPQTLAETEAETQDRFTVESEHHSGLHIKIITDTATGKEYIVAMSGYAGVAVLEG